MKTTTIIGLGLIGSSFALGIRREKLSDKIVGVDKNLKHCQYALNLGIVDSIKELDESIFDSDLVVLAVPINTIRELLPKVLDIIRGQTIVIDMGSTKEAICSSVKMHQNRKNYVATHPIAGTENSGPKAAFANLFEDKISIICDREESKKEFVDTVEKIYQSINMKLIFMSSSAHDEHIAYVSHLSHITSFALGQTVLNEEKNEETIFDMAGSGFESTVRLAKSSPEMWTPILLENKKNILKAINSYEKELNELKKMISNNDNRGIEDYLARTNDIRRILENNKV